MAGTQFEEHFNDTVFEYRIGKDTMGEYLFISSFKYNVSYVDITNWGVKFRPAKKRDLIFKKIFYFYSEYSAVHQL